MRFFQIKKKPFSSVPLPPAEKMTSDPDTLTRLSAWDQAAMRTYMRFVLCFPFDNTALTAAAEHIEASLARLARQRPDFAGTLEVHKGGIVYLRTRASHSREKPKIPFSIVDIASQFPYASYDELKEAEYPPAAFVGSHFAHPCVLSEGEPGVPVAVVKAFIIPGGLMLGIFFCHASADGDCLRIFLDAFSGQTRNKLVSGASVRNLNVLPPGGLADGSDARLNSLLKRIPEYVILDDPVGPTAPKLRAGGVPMDEIAKTGKVFVFNNNRLNELRRSLVNACGKTTEAVNGASNNCAHGNGNENENENGNGNGNTNNTGAVGQTPPSVYTCLAALTWAHVVRARMADTAEYVPHSPATDGTALLQTMVNWKSRAFQKENPNYFGNATAVAVTRLPTDDSLLTEAPRNMSQLAELVYAIEKTIAGVNDDYVRDRTELFTLVDDPRRIGLRFDPRTRQDLGFNTWRYFGADTEWAIPGVGHGVMSPDRIRRLQDVWNMSGALILPAKSSSTIHELLVTLPQSSMDLLCQDPDWMCWVDRVIG